MLFRKSFHLIAEVTHLLHVIQDRLPAHVERQKHWSLHRDQACRGKQRSKGLDEMIAVIFINKDRATAELEIAVLEEAEGGVEHHSIVGGESCCQEVARFKT